MKTFTIQLKYDETADAAYIYLPMFYEATGQVTTLCLNNQINIDKVGEKMLGIEILNAGEKLFIAI